MRKSEIKAGSSLLLAGVIALLAGRACSQETYGPYNVIVYDYTNRSIFLELGEEGLGVRASGGRNIICCLDIPRNAKTLRFKVWLGMTQYQYNAHLPDDEIARENTYETGIPVPELPNKHRGYIEVHFLPGWKIEAKWVDFPTRPHIPDATD